MPSVYLECDKCGETISSTDIKTAGDKWVPSPEFVAYAEAKGWQFIERMGESVAHICPKCANIQIV